MTSATSSSSSSTDRRSSEPEHTANAVVIKEESIEENIEEKEVATYSIEVSAEAAAAVPIKLEEVLFDWPGNENDDDDGNSY